MAQLPHRVPPWPLCQLWEHSQSCPSKRRPTLAPPLPRYAREGVAYGTIQKHLNKELPEHTALERPATLPEPLPCTGTSTCQ